MMQDSSSWLDRLAAGDVRAADDLWQHFFLRLHRYVQVRLSTLPRAAGDADDVTMSVFKSICRLIDQRTLPSVRDPEALWPFLAVIAARKVARLVRRARPGRPGQQIRETDLARLGVDAGEVVILDKVMAREPSAELIVAVRDVWEVLLHRLDARGESVARNIAPLWLEGKTVAEMAAAANVSKRTTARKLELIRRWIRELSGEAPETA